MWTHKRNTISRGCVEWDSSPNLPVVWFDGLARWSCPKGTLDDVIKWKHFPRYWPFLRGIYRSPVNSPRKGQWRGALMFSLTCAWINGWVNNRAAGDLRRHRTHSNEVEIHVFWEKYRTDHFCIVGEKSLFDILFSENRDAARQESHQVHKVPNALWRWNPHQIPHGRQQRMRGDPVVETVGETEHFGHIDMVLFLRIQIICSKSVVN